MSQTLDRIRIALVCAIALLLPINFLSVTILTGLLLLTVLLLSIREGFRFTDRSPTWWIFIGIAATTAIGLIYTTNLTEGFSNLKVKGGLLAFPLIFLLQPVRSSDERRAAANSFCMGLVIAALLCLSTAGWRYHQTGDSTQLFYQNLSLFMHPSYFALYLTLGLLFAGELLLRAKTVGRRVALLLLLLFYVFTIVMLQSKAGLLVSTITLGLFLLIGLYRNRRYVETGMAIALFALTYWSTTKYVVTSANSRVYNATYNITHFDAKAEKAPESSQIRMLVWKSDLDVIRAHPVLGVGTGDVVDALVENYKAKNIEQAVEERLNAHDQYLQTWLESGLAGLILLLLSFLLPFWKSIRRRDVVFALFLVAAGINFGVESMFCVQAGTLFFGFFYALLLSSLQQDLF